MVAEAEYNNLGEEVLQERFERWHTCSLCEQRYHGAVACALGWACWKTYLGRPENDGLRSIAMLQLGNGLHSANQFEDCLSVQMVELSTMRRIGAPEQNILVMQGNISCTYQVLGRFEQALSMRRDVYNGGLKIHGEHHEETITAAGNYAITCINLERFEEAKSLLRKIMPVSQRVHGTEHMRTISLREDLARAMLDDRDSSLVEIREALETLEEILGVMQRVMGASHPETRRVQQHLKAYRDYFRTT